MKRSISVATYYLLLPLLAAGALGLARWSAKDCGEGGLTADGYWPVAFAGDDDDDDSGECGCWEDAPFPCLALRFGDPRLRVSRVTAAEGEELEVIATFHSEVPLRSWQFQILPDNSVGPEPELEFIDASTHESVLALGPSVETTVFDAGSVSSEVVLKSPLDMGRSTFPVVRVRFRVTDFAGQKSARLRLWLSDTPFVVHAHVLRAEPPGTLRTLPGFVVEPYAAIAAPAGITSTGGPYSFLVGTDGLGPLRSIQCHSPQFEYSYGTEYLDPRPIYWGSLPIVAAKDPNTLEGAIFLGDSGPIFGGLQRPGALLVHDDKLYFADIPEQRIFVAESTANYQPFLDVPTEPHSLAMVADRMYIGGESDGSIWIYNLKEQSFADEPLLSGLGPKVSIIGGQGDEIWGERLYLIPQAGLYGGSLISLEEGEEPRVIACGFEGSVDLTFADSIRFLNLPNSILDLYAAETVRNRVTRILPRARGGPEVVFAAVEGGLARRFQGSTELVVTDLSFTGLAYDGNERLWGIGTPVGASVQSLYRLDNALGSLRVNEVTHLATNDAMTALEWIGETLVAAADSPEGGSALHEVDTETGNVTPIDLSESSPIERTELGRIGGLAYDSLQTLYAVSESGESLYGIDWPFGDGKEPTVSLVGDTGLVGITTSGLHFDDDAGILLMIGRRLQGDRRQSKWALDVRTGAAGLPVDLDAVGGSHPVGAIAVRQSAPRSQVISSSDVGMALPVSGTLSEELALLNAGPPPFDAAEWQPVVRQASDQAEPFICGEVSDSFEGGFVNAREYMVGVDEVTLDNCSAAFYRFTFELPPVFESACISGVANVDDQAVVFLNGRRISAAMREPDCDPITGAGDPCYGEQDHGTDSQDADGRRVLTAPTQDPFGTCERFSFLPGRNELVFAVSGNASPEDPTGLEFTAAVAIDCPFDASYPSGPLPVLAVTHISTPERASPGETIEARWEVTNAGFASAQGWTDGVGVQNAAQTAAFEARGTSEFEGTLAPGESVERTGEFTAPSVPGYFRLSVTAGRDTPQWYRGRSAVVDDRTLIVPGPDLVVTDVTVPAGKKPVLAGTSTEISYTVKNVGEGPAMEQWVDELRLYVAELGCEPSESPLCGNVIAVLPPSSNKRVLGPGESYTLTVPVPLPDKLAATYYVRAETDVDQAVREMIEANNGRSSETFAAVISGLQPDLVAEDIRFPAKVFPSTPFLVSWTDWNRGSGQTEINNELEGKSEWMDAIYLSTNTDPSISPGDFLLRQTQRSGPPLLPRNSQAREFRTYIPLVTSGTFHLKVYVDSKGEISEFGFEGNNVAVAKSPLTVLPALPIDLVPTQLEILEQWRTHLVVRFGVENIGAPLLPHHSYRHDNRIYLGDVELDVWPFFTSLSAGRTPYSFVRSFDIRQVPDGVAELRLAIDVDDDIPEESEKNNVVTLDVDIRSPDLAVEIVEAPGEVVAGETIDVRWRVTNVGDVVAQIRSWPSAHLFSWYDSVLLRSTRDGQEYHLAARDVDELLLSSRCCLKPGESYENSVTANLNWPLLQSDPGAYELVVETDVRDSHDANLENNATSVELVVAPNSSDVAITSLSVLPVPGRSSDVVQVEWREQNVSPFPFAGSWRPRLIVAGNRAWSGGLTDLLAPGESIVHSTLVDLLRADVAPGEAALIVATSDRVDANSENNTYTVETVRSAPDFLTVKDVAISGDVIAGQPVEVSWTVEVDEIAPAHAGIRARVALSRSGEDVELARGPGASVRPGSSHRDALTVTLPESAIGPWLLVVTEEPVESYPSAQQAVPVDIASPLVADIEVTEIAVPATGRLGEPVVIEWHTWNHGPEAAQGRWYDSIYLSLDTSWDPGDQFLGRFYTGEQAPLEAGTSRLFEGNPILGRVDPGDYHVLVRTDVFDYVNETDEANNLTASAGTLRVSALQLELGEPHVTSLVSGQDLYLELPDVPEGETLRLRIDHASPVVQSELYARHGAVATAGRFDRRFRAPGEPDQIVIVPTTRAGSYFFLAKASGLTTTSQSKQVTFLAEIVPFQVESVSPARIGDRGRVTLSISGSKFDPMGEVFLENDSGTRLPAYHTEYLDATRWRATFLLDGLLHGPRHVVVTRSDGEVTRLDGAVTVEAARGPFLEAAAPRPAAARPGPTPGAITLAVANQGNVDADYVLLLNSETSAQGRAVASTSASSPFHGSRRADGLIEQSALLRGLAPGETGFLTTLLRPGQSSSGYIVLGNSIALLTAEKMLELQENLAEATRQSVVANPQSVLEDERERILALAMDASSWHEFWFEGLVSTGVVLAEDLELLGQGREVVGEARCSTRVEEVEFPEFCDSLDARLCSAWSSRALEAGIVGARVFTSPPDVKLSDCGPGAIIGDSISCSFCSIWRIQQSVDPNEKSGSDGVGDEDYVPKTKPIRYRVDFENVASAVAPAAVVRITDPIDPALRLASFRLERIAFGDTVIDIPPDSITFQRRLDLRGTHGVMVDVTAGVDPMQGHAFWNFRSIDPDTGETPASSRLGFLPPNDASGAGRGWVEYSLRPHVFARSGPVRNEATISFDANVPLNTNVVLYKLDADAPVSRVETVERIGVGAARLEWSGSDPGGSGIDAFAIYAAKEGGEYVEVIAATSATEATLELDTDGTYAFYSVATDHVGNVEEPPAEPDVWFSPSERPFTRGDCNGDGRIDLSDAIFHLNWNFAGSRAPGCRAACDANGDGRITGEVSDALWLLGHLFAGGPPPVPPFPECGAGERPTDTLLGCEAAPACP